MEHSLAAEDQDELTACVTDTQVTVQVQKTHIIAQVSEVLAVVKPGEHTTSDRAEPQKNTTMLVIPLLCDDKILTDRQVASTCRSTSKCEYCVFLSVPVDDGYDNDQCSTMSTSIALRRLTW